MFWILLIVGIVAILTSLFVPMQDLLGKGIVTLGMILAAIGLIGAVTCFSIYNAQKVDIATDIELLEIENRETVNAVQLYISNIPDDCLEKDNLIYDAEHVAVLKHLPAMQQHTYVLEASGFVAANNKALLELNRSRAKLKVYKPWIFMD